MALPVMNSQTLEYGAPKAKSIRVRWRDMRGILTLAAVLVVAETGCAVLAYYTIGEIVSGMYFLLVLMNAIPLGVAFLNRRLAAAGFLLLAMMIIPYQSVLGVRWWRVHREAQRVVAWAQAQNGKTGAWPTDLSGYTFRDPGTRDFITYWGNPNSGPAGQAGTVSYSIGSGSTAHWYEPSAGWMYYAD